MIAMSFESNLGHRVTVLKQKQNDSNKTETFCKESCRHG